MKTKENQKSSSLLNDTKPSCQLSVYVLRYVYYVSFWIQTPMTKVLIRTLLSFLTDVSVFNVLSDEPPLCFRCSVRVLRGPCKLLLKHKCVIHLPLGLAVYRLSPVSFKITLFSDIAHIAPRWLTWAKLFIFSQTSTPCGQCWIVLLHDPTMALTLSEEGPQRLLSFDGKRLGSVLPRGFRNQLPEVSSG